MNNKIFKMDIPTIKTSILPLAFNPNNTYAMGTKWRNSETEASASWLLRFAIERGNWNPFTLKDINTFYQKNYPNHNFNFNYLLTRGDIVQIKKVKLSLKKVKPYLYIENNWNEGWTDQELVVNHLPSTFYFTDSFILEMYKHLVKK